MYTFGIEHILEKGGLVQIIDQFLAMLFLGKGLRCTKEEKKHFNQQTPLRSCKVYLKAIFHSYNLDACTL